MYKKSNPSSSPRRYASVGDQYLAASPGRTSGARRTSLNPLRVDPSSAEASGEPPSPRSPMVPLVLSKNESAEVDPETIDLVNEYIEQIQQTAKEEMTNPLTPSSVDLLHTSATSAAAEPSNLELNSEMLANVSRYIDALQRDQNFQQEVQACLSNKSSEELVEVQGSESADSLQKYIDNAHQVAQQYLEGGSIEEEEEEEIEIEPTFSNEILANAHNIAKQYLTATPRDDDESEEEKKETDSPVLQRRFAFPTEPKMELDKAKDEKPEAAPPSNPVDRSNSRESPLLSTSKSRSSASVSYAEVKAAVEDIVDSASMDDNATVATQDLSYDMLDKIKAYIEASAQDHVVIPESGELSNEGSDSERAALTSSSSSTEPVRTIDSKTPIESQVSSAVAPNVFRQPVTSKGVDPPSATRLFGSDVSLRNISRTESTDEMVAHILKARTVETASLDPESYKPLVRDYSGELATRHETPLSSDGKTDVAHSDGDTHDPDGVVLCKTESDNALLPKSSVADEAEDSPRKMSATAIRCSSDDPPAVDVGAKIEEWNQESRATGEDKLTDSTQEITSLEKQKAQCNDFATESPDVLEKSRERGAVSETDHTVEPDTDTCESACEGTSALKAPFSDKHLSAGDEEFKSPLVKLRSSLRGAQRRIQETYLDMKLDPNSPIQESTEENESLYVELQTNLRSARHRPQDSYRDMALDSKNSLLASTKELHHSESKSLDTYLDLAPETSSSEIWNRTMEESTSRAHGVPASESVDCNLSVEPGTHHKKAVEVEGDPTDEQLTIKEYPSTASNIVPIVVANDSLSRAAPAPELRSDRVGTIGGNAEPSLLPEKDPSKRERNINVEPVALHDTLPPLKSLSQATEAVTAGLAPTLTDISIPIVHCASSVKDDREGQTRTQKYNAPASRDAHVPNQPVEVAYTNPAVLATEKHAPSPESRPYQQNFRNSKDGPRAISGSTTEPLLETCLPALSHETVQRDEDYLLSEESTAEEATDDANRTSTNKAETSKGLETSVEPSYAEGAIVNTMASPLGTLGGTENPTSAVTGRTVSTAAMQIGDKAVKNKLSPPIPEGASTEKAGRVSENPCSPPDDITKPVAQCARAPVGGRETSTLEAVERTLSNEMLVLMQQADDGDVRTEPPTTEEAAKDIHGRPSPEKVTAGEKTEFSKVSAGDNIKPTARTAVASVDGGGTPTLEAFERTLSNEMSIPLKQTDDDVIPAPLMAAKDVSGLPSPEKLPAGKESGLTESTARVAKEFVALAKVPLGGRETPNLEAFERTLSNEMAVLMKQTEEDDLVSAPSMTKDAAEDVPDQVSQDKSTKGEIIIDLSHVSAENDIKPTARIAVASVDGRETPNLEAFERTLSNEMGVRSKQTNDDMMYTPIVTESAAKGVYGQQSPEKPLTGKERGLAESIARVAEEVVAQAKVPLGGRETPNLEAFERTLSNEMAVLMKQTDDDVISAASMTAKDVTDKPSPQKSVSEKELSLAESTARVAKEVVALAKVPLGGRETPNLEAFERTLSNEMVVLMKQTDDDVISAASMTAKDVTDKPSPQKSVSEKELSLAESTARVAKEVVALAKVPLGGRETPNLEAFERTLSNEMAVVMKQTDDDVVSAPSIVEKGAPELEVDNPNRPPGAAHSLKPSFAITGSSEVEPVSGIMATPVGGEPLPGKTSDAVSSEGTKSSFVQLRSNLRDLQKKFEGTYMSLGTAATAPEVENPKGTLQSEAEKSVDICNARTKITKESPKAPPTLGQLSSSVHNGRASPLLESVERTLSNELDFLSRRIGPNKEMSRSVTFDEEPRQQPVKAPTPRTLLPPSDNVRADPVPCEQLVPAFEGSRIAENASNLVSLTSGETTASPDTFESVQSDVDAVDAMQPQHSLDVLVNELAVVELVQKLYCQIRASDRRSDTELRQFKDFVMICYKYFDGSEPTDEEVGRVMNEANRLNICPDLIDNFFAVALSGVEPKRAASGIDEAPSDELVEAKVRRQVQPTPETGLEQVECFLRRIVDQEESSKSTNFQAASKDDDVDSDSNESDSDQEYRRREADEEGPWWEITERVESTGGDEESVSSSVDQHAKENVAASRFVDGGAAAEGDMEDFWKQQNQQTEKQKAAHPVVYRYPHNIMPHDRPSDSRSYKSRETAPSKASVRKKWIRRRSMAQWSKNKQWRPNDWLSNSEQTRVQVEEPEPIDGTEAAAKLFRPVPNGKCRDGRPMSYQWRLPYKYRTRDHKGYYDADIYSLYSSSAVVVERHELDDQPWEHRGVKQRFLHEQSLQLCRNWFGDVNETRGNDKYVEPVSSVTSMKMPMKAGEWTEDWYKQSLKSPSKSVSVLNKEIGHALMRANAIERRPLCPTQYESSYDCDSAWERPECGKLQNTQLKIGDRISRVTPDLTSSLRRSRWRKKHFPQGSFPYNS